MEPRVWLIGGTSESAELARALLAHDIPYVVTVTTPAARELYPKAREVKVGALSPEAMASFVMSQNVWCILDASHPFASEVSQRAIALSNRSHVQHSHSQRSDLDSVPQGFLTPDLLDLPHAITYLRYERPAVATPNEQADCIKAETSLKSDIRNIADKTLPLPKPSASACQLTMVASIDALMDSDLLCHQRVLFTLGYRSLARFASLRATSQLFARVLPSEAAITGAIAAGFSAREIIALRPPVSLSLEKALWQQWRISQVVAKASGQPGGETVKRQAAQQLGVHLVLIQRPPIDYPNQTHSVEEAVIFCAETLRVY